jgi:hypothetical protein
MFTQMHEGDVCQLQIVWPNKEDMKRGLGTIKRYVFGWKASPALLLIKPHLGVIVSLQELNHDERCFTLILATDAAIVAPADFDPRAPIKLACLWNQPYLSMGRDHIYAPYDFSLFFGVQGVRRVHEWTSKRSFERLRNTPFVLPCLRACFRTDFQPSQ